MKTEHMMRSELEAKVRELLADYNETAWTTDTALVAIVFRAMWSSALTIEQINRIGGALVSYESDANLQAAITKMTRANVFRTSRKAGKTFYELNY